MKSSQVVVKCYGAYATNLPLVLRNQIKQWKLIPNIFITPNRKSTPAIHIQHIHLFVVHIFSLFSLVLFQLRHSYPLSHLIWRIDYFFSHNLYRCNWICTLRVYPNIKIHECQDLTSNWPCYRSTSYDPLIGLISVQPFPTLQPSFPIKSVVVTGFNTLDTLTILIHLSIR